MNTSHEKAWWSKSSPEHLNTSNVRISMRRGTPFPGGSGLPGGIIVLLPLMLTSSVTSSSMFENLSIHCMSPASSPPGSRLVTGLPSFLTISATEPR